MSGRGYDRRQAAGRIAAAALLPFAALGLPLSSAAATLRVRAIPEGQFLLERVLTRELGDGASIIVTRRWRIGFAAAVPGMAVSGEQTFAEVAAPPRLSPLATLEKARSTAEMFPIRLDRMGQIAGNERSMEAAQLMRAIDTGRALLERAGAPGAAQDARGFMAQLAAMGAEAVSIIPRDLFFPEPARSSAARHVALPDGDRGTIRVDTDATVYTETGLLRTSERVILTRIGGSIRTSREGWSLTPFR